MAGICHLISCLVHLRSFHSDRAKPHRLHRTVLLEKPLDLFRVEGGRQVAHEDCPALLFVVIVTVPFPFFPLFCVLTLFFNLVNDHMRQFHA